MLVLVGAAGVAAAVPALRRVALPSPFGRRSADTGSDPAGDLTLERFTPYVGSRFTVRSGGGAGVAVALHEATAREAHPADHPRLQGESFSLIFRGQGHGAFGDGVHTLVHPALGTFSLFLVAVGRRGSEQDYQAVVDRRLPPR